MAWCGIEGAVERSTKPDFPSPYQLRNRLRCVVFGHGHGRASDSATTGPARIRMDVNVGLCVCALPLRSSRPLQRDRGELRRNQPLTLWNSFDSPPLILLLSPHHPPGRTGRQCVKPGPGRTLFFLVSLATAGRDTKDALRETILVGRSASRLSPT